MPVFSVIRGVVRSLADRFVPPGTTDIDALHRTRAAILQTSIGVFFTALFGLLYAVSGSPWSGVAILLVTLGLLGTPEAIRRGVSVLWIGNALVGLTWVATFVVASRSGGFTSPAVVWSFLFPLSTYAVCGKRSAVVWSVLSGAQILFFFAADLAGVGFAQDFTPRVLSVLRISGYAGVITTIMILLSVIESARHAAFEAIDAQNRTRDRARILDDMHDGVGSQLLGLIVQLRAGAIEPPRVVDGLESCLDDLRLIVASLDVAERDFDVALGELRARLEPRCNAAGVELRWGTALERASAIDGAAVMHVLRALQEMLTNALRHSKTARVDVTIAPAEDERSMLVVTVRDFGDGFDPSNLRRAGRGLKSLKARAHKLGGEFQVVAANPGTLARLRFPVSARAT